MFNVFTAFKYKLIVNLFSDHFSSTNDNNFTIKNVTIFVKIHQCIFCKESYAQLLHVLSSIYFYFDRAFVLPNTDRYSVVVI